VIDRRQFWLALGALALGLTTASLPGCGGGGGETTPTGATKTDTTEVVESPPEATPKKKAK